jgi:hypothetical protein
VVGHIFQAHPVWMYTQSNITQASYSPEYITPTQQKSWIHILLARTVLYKTKASPVWMCTQSNITNIMNYKIFSTIFEFC